MKGSDLREKRRRRRRILASFTALTVLLVLVGAFGIPTQLARNPLSFAIFWTASFLCVMLVIVFALLDIRLLRKEHRRRRKALDAELAKIISDAEEEAEIAGKKVD